MTICKSQPFPRVLAGATGKTPAALLAIITVLSTLALGLPASATAPGPPASTPALGPPTSTAALSPPTSTPLSAQATPGTDIWVMDLQESGGAVRVSNPVRISNRAGYDNQPHFGPGGAYVLYTSIDDAGQADILRYDFSSGRSENLTRTAAESEYSATLMPGGDRFSAIRVEVDSTQRLWSFDLSGSDPQVVLHSVMPVGYHAWIDAETLALFVLGSPATLQIAVPETQAAQIRAEDIGRSLHKVPQHRLASFLQWETRDGERVGVIKTIDPDSGETEEAGVALEGGQDYAWTVEGVILMAAGSTLFSFSPGDEAGWREVADLAAVGIDGISRLAVSPDGSRLAVVGEEAQ
jgi:hypothetical protein